MPAETFELTLRLTRDEIEQLLQLVSDGVQYRVDDLDGIPEDDGDRVDIAEMVDGYEALAAKVTAAVPVE